MNLNYLNVSEDLKERYELSKNRILQIIDEESVVECYRLYFKRLAKLISLCNIILEDNLKSQEKKDRAELEIINKNLYGDLLPDKYVKSYANPDYCVSMFGNELGKLLSFITADIRSVIGFAYEAKVYELTLYQELFIQIYNCFENTECPDIKEIKDIIYWFNFDYTDIFMENLVKEQYDPSNNFAIKIIMDSNLEDYSYLYKYGEYISANELEMAYFLNNQSIDTIKSMADTMTEGYRIGFELARKDLSSRKYASIHYPIGFERVMREVVKNLRALGLEVLCFRAPMQSGSRNRLAQVGFYSTSPNKQFDYDHKDDIALYYDNNYAERKLDELKKAYELNKEYMKYYAGPAVMETFGEAPFLPIDKEASYTLDENQRKIRVNYQSKSRQLLTDYIDYEKRSFTIIAYPSFEIGKNFPEIFNEIIKINTLDYKKYSQVQQNIIKVLDLCDYVEIKGNNGNKTDLRVALCDIQNPEKESKFENCVADVNIPVGEVFTSPKLSGTNGTLHVSSVYLNGLRFENINIHFKDGMIDDYSCTNFKDLDKCRNYIKENVLFFRDTLPMGEFAIGTNTNAYVLAEQYNIADKLPILIAEKMGPHFAVGDTCYSLNEDIKVYNPDGKEIICRDNEITKEYRNSDMSKAYFNCHTDITIPYSELGSIIAYDTNGNGTTIIENGRFVLPGTEFLNEPFNK